MDVHPFDQWAPTPVMAEHFSKPPPPSLYHYTDQAGLLGILKSKVVWATNAHYLNDHQEFKVGADLILKTIEKKIEAARDERSIAALKEMVGVAFMPTPVRTSYVASWSAAPDDLAQWRAYSGRGTGYAIEMAGETIQRLATNQGFKFAECIYDADAQSRWASEIVDTSLQEMLEQGGISADPLLFRILQFAPLFKHHAFRGEREWRLIANFMVSEIAENFDVRAGRSMLIPYTQFALETADIPIALSSVVVGPCAELELAAAATMAAFNKYIHQQGYSVRWSQVPYRNW